MAGEVADVVAEEVADVVAEITVMAVTPCISTFNIHGHLQLNC